MTIKKTRFKQYLYKWLEYKKDYVKESTYANYSNIIYNYIIPILGDYSINAINHELIQNYILTLYKNGGKNSLGLSIKTIKDIISILKASIRFLFNKKAIKPFDLKFNYPKNNFNKNVYVLTKDEQNKIMKYAINNLNYKNIGILICLFAGIRIGEVCALKWKDINFNNGLINIDKTIQRIYIRNKNNNYSKIIISTPKTKNANRIIPLNKDFIKILKSLKNDNENYILTGSNKFIEPRVYRNYFNNVLKKLEIKHFNFHSLRHTFATNCISLGIDYKTVSELLGHSNINMTLNLYVHPSLSQKEKCINILYNKLMK